MAKKSLAEVSRIVADALAEIGEEADDMEVLGVLCVAAGGMIPPMIFNQSLELKDMQSTIWSFILRGAESSRDRLIEEMRHMAGVEADQ